jgi:hypothetical protein
MNKSTAREIAALALDGELYTHEALAALKAEYKIVKEYYTDEAFDSLMNELLKLERRKLTQEELEVN